ncbi:hypothetical protein GGTG_09611 [Gaeumannomyces tritici R3-111a-1]|uniref:Uncharacterized protein n=1 Tax=Gaeumannomyces tritici (strain R3-111a-1) TaxID=644352 RepID=J3P7X1_GAET3|nr:hypothetical protein GGTG_09611 [Gaeumannomyces tritici R3-111a-1]EJT72754.1 hypothetical protein GGTG_09611 [Gaeumannomyces tritici R3-111a-1]
MSGVVEIIGAVAAGVQITAQIVRIFRTARNALRQVERLHRLLEELEGNRELLNALSTKEGERSARAIYDLINNCRDLIEEKAGAKMAPIDKARNFFWPAENEEYLRKHIDEIRQEIISLGIWLNFGLGKGAQSLVPVADLISGPPRGLNDTLFSDGTTIVSSPTIGLGVVASPQASVAPSSPVVSGGRAPRRSTTYSGPTDLPTVLTLQRSDGKQFVAPMALDRLSIMERDESIRTIEYEATGGSKTGPLRITHRIPRGTIRIEDNDLNDLCVCFLDAHVITIQNSEGYRIHRIHAEYSFRSVESRERFLLKVRERELLGRFTAKCIRKGNGQQILAQSKVVRLWRKLQEEGHAGVRRRMTHVTVSFLGRDEKQYEVPLADFHRQPHQQGNVITLISKADRGSDGLHLEFYPAPRSPVPSRERQKSSWRPFGSSTSPPSSPTLTTPAQSDADRFKAVFMENHPSTVTWTPLPPINVDETDSLSKDAHIQVFSAPNWGALSSSASSTAATASSGSSNITSYTIASSRHNKDVDAYSTSPGSRGFLAEFENALELRLGSEKQELRRACDSDRR